MANKAQRQGGKRQGRGQGQVKGVAHHDSYRTTMTHGVHPRCYGCARPARACARGGGWGGAAVQNREMTNKSTG